MTKEELRHQFHNEEGISWENSQGEPDIDYVLWLESKILRHEIAERMPAEVLSNMKWLLMDDALKCPHCGGVGFIIKPNYHTGEPEQEQCRWCYEFDWFRNRMKGTQINNSALFKISSQNYGDDGIGLSGEEFNNLI